VANIDRIVNVQIALRSVGIQQQTFSDLLLVGPLTMQERVRVITDPDELLAPGLDITPASPLYKAASVAFSQTPTINRLFVGRRDPEEGAAAAMAAIRAENQMWYGVSDVTHTGSDVIAFAQWAEANDRLFLTTLSEPESIGAGGTGLASQLKAGNYFRTAWWYNSDPEEFPEVGNAARAFTVPPGGETWANMRISAVTSTPLTETAYLNLTAKNGNSFEPFRNIAITQNGRTAGGEWIDIIRFRDWLCEEIRTRVFTAMVDNRIPFTDPGISIIRQQVTAALDLGVRRKGIAPPEVDADTDKVIPSYTVYVPPASQISSIDKANRILRDVSFTARLAGAIHATEIRGTLTYDNLPVAAT